MSRSPSFKIHCLPSQPKKKDGDRKRTGQTKVAVAELEGFMDWAGLISSDLTEEEEMFMLAAGFAVWMRKRIVD